jgi:hypothetical protein
MDVSASVEKSIIGGFQYCFSQPLPPVESEALTQVRLVDEKKAPGAREAQMLRIGYTNSCCCKGVTFIAILLFIVDVEACMNRCERLCVGRKTQRCGLCSCYDQGEYEILPVASCRLSFCISMHRWGIEARRGIKQFMYLGLSTLVCDRLRCFT